MATTVETNFWGKIYLYIFIYILKKILLWRLYIYIYISYLMVKNGVLYYAHDKSVIFFLNRDFGIFVKFE